MCLASFAVAAAAPWTAAPSAQGAHILDAATLTKYVDPLPNLLDRTIQPTSLLGGAPLYEISISQFQQQLHSELPPTTLWGYNGTYPGPTFDVMRDAAIKVRWTNNLVDVAGAPLQHFLPYDPSLHGVGGSGGHAGHGASAYPQARTVTHLHGGVVDAVSDGYPEHWFTADPNAAANGLGGPAGNNLVTTYTNPQRAAALWYHDHAMAITRLNVYAGLAGFYLLRDAEEATLGLPSGDYEIPLMLQDRSFYDDGHLYYPGGDAADPAAPGNHVSLFLGDANLVNGVIWPFLNVEPRKYRFRLLNAANSRVYNLALAPDAGAASTDDVALHQIGTDGGLFATRVPRANVELYPSDRADVVVDFSQFSIGDTLRLLNRDANASEDTTGQVMQFRVVPPTGVDLSRLPDALSTIERRRAEDAVRVRTLQLVRGFDDEGRVRLLLDGKRWTDDVTETVIRGDMEIWELRNTTGEDHPIHIHLEAFQILSRTDIGGNEIPVENYDQGWEDTFPVRNGEVVRFAVEFSKFKGTFVWHCHILEHEDHEMMRPLRIVTEVVPEPASGTIACILAAALAVRRRRNAVHRADNEARASRLPEPAVPKRGRPRLMLFSAAFTVLAIAGGAPRTSAQTNFLAHLHVVPTATQPLPAFGVARMTLSADQSELHYAIQFQQLDLEPNPTLRTDPEDIVGIHMHLIVPDVVGPHILNVFGIPSEDDADLAVDFDNESLTGRFDLSDASVDPATGEPYPQFFPLTTKIIHDWTDELLANQLYLAVHTAGENGGALLHGDVIWIVPEPGPTPMLAACLAGAILSFRHRKRHCSSI